MSDQKTAFYKDEIDLREIVDTLMRGWKVVLLMVLTGGAASGFS